MRRRLLGLALAGAAVVASTGAAASTAEITMPGKFFAPGQLDVLVGTTVTWRNTDHSTHTVTEDDDVFDSGHIRPGDDFVRTFPQTGTFQFHCAIHRFMRGSVSVFDVVLRGPDEPLPAGRSAVLEGTAPAGVEEVALDRILPGPVETVAVVETEPEGAFRFVVPAPEPRRYRVRAGGAMSPIVRVRVMPRVSLARRGRGFAVHALPARPGAPVVLQRYHRELFSFVTVARGRLDALSRAVVAYRPHGREHLRAVVRGTHGWSDGISRPVVASAR
jgi:plastocyanin